MVKSFEEFLEEEKQLILEKATGGSASNHNGALSEIGFKHTISRYAQLRAKGHDHDSAMGKLRNANSSVGRPIRPSKIGPKSEYHSRVTQATNALGEKAARRTLWDSHHAALDTIDHIHNKIGTIEHNSVMWTAPDASGERTKSVVGHNTPADVVFRVKKHDGSGEQNVRLAHSDSADDHESGSHERKWMGTSLKYSQKTSKDPTKLRAHGYNSLNSIIQQAHRDVHGTEHDGLNRATKSMALGNKAAEQEVLAKHHDFLHGVFGVNPKPGAAPKLRNDKPTIFRHEADGTRSLNPKAHSYLKAVAKGDYDEPSGHKKTGEMGKVEHPHKAGAQAFLKDHAETTGDVGHYRDQLHDAIHSVMQGSSDHSKSVPQSKRTRIATNMYRKLTNIPESRSQAASGAKTLLVNIKSRREKDNHSESNRQKPDVHITDPSARVDSWMRDARRKGANPLKYLTPKKGGGDGSLKVGRLNLSVDTKVKGVNAHMSHHHLFGEAPFDPQEHK